MKNHTRIPKNHPVQPLKLGQKAEDKVTCGYCGLSWDDGKCTSMTPAPSARCPFEEFHIHPDGKDEPAEDKGKAEMLAALEMAAKLIKTARKHFPKSIRNPDRFQLELTCAAVTSAIHHQQ